LSERIFPKRENPLRVSQAKKVKNRLKRKPPEGKKKGRRSSWKGNTYPSRLSGQDSGQGRSLEKSMRGDTGGKNRSNWITKRRRGRKMCGRRKPAAMRRGTWFLIELAGGLNATSLPFVTLELGNSRTHTSSGLGKAKLRSQHQEGRT